jgi:hypothetical protein
MVNLNVWVKRVVNCKRSGGVEGGYKVLVSGRGWFASPAAPADSTPPPSVRRREPLPVLACCLAACLVAGAAPCLARAAPGSAACPEMLMDFECAQYRQRIAQAGNEVQRERIVNEYALIVKERYRLCPVPRGSVRHAATSSNRSAP